MIVCTAANPSIDKTVVVQALGPGTIHRPSSVWPVPGGKGLNCARAAQRLGGDVVAVPVLRGHAGRWIEEELARLDIACAAVHRRGETRSSLSVLAEHDGSLTEFHEPGDAIAGEEWREMCDVAVGAAGEGDWIVVAGSMPPGSEPEWMGDFADRIHGIGARCAVDLRGEALRVALRAAPDIVKVNLEEAEDLFGLHRCDGAGSVDGRVDGGEVHLGRAARGALRLREAVGNGETLVVVTAGEHGAAMCAGSGQVLEATSECRGRYAVGSGDAFLGAMVGYLDTRAPADWSISSTVDAFRLGMGTGAANALTPGAATFDPREAHALADQVAIRERSA